MIRQLIHGRIRLVTIAVVVGAAWRLWLMQNYAGWEESDYGNLAMIQGVLDGGFRHYDMNHMPGYYAVSALVHALVQDSMVAGRIVSFTGGMVALALATLLASQLGGRRAGWLAGALLVVQPEFSLYAASSLREPLAAAFVMGTLTALSRERMVVAGLCAAGAFFVRFDLALVMMPLLSIHAFGVSSEDRLRRMVSGVVPLVSAITVWAVYCKVDHGTFAFWSHSVSVNIETGMGGEAEAPGSWWVNGAKVSAGLVSHVLPWRIGWLVWLGLLWAGVAGIRQSHGLWRTMAVCALLMVGLWAGIGFVGQHELGHNLYWKWLNPLIPVVLPLGALGVWRGADRLGRFVGTPAALLCVGLGLTQAIASNLKETDRQRARSEAWYRPQLQLAQWIEANVAPGTPMVVDNIPACWIRRRPNDHRMTSWFDVPVCPGNETDFARWIQAEGIEWVMWFQEDWTQAPVIAPFLRQGGRWASGETVLIEREREEGYGWIWFEVARSSE